MTQLQLTVHDAVMQFVPFIIEGIFYGVYSVLFSLCIYVLWKRQEMQKRFQHLVFMIALYLLATVHIILICILAFRYDLASLGYYAWASAFVYISQNQSSVPRAAMNICIALKILYFVSNLLADAVVIYRCYLVWGMSKRVIIFPILAYILTIASFPLQFSSDGTLGDAGIIAGLCMTFIANLLAVGLTGGRIWWITRQAQALLSDKTKERYNSATAVILESGILYPVALLLAVITFFTGGPSAWVFVALIHQLVGIAPTLIIVRVGLGVTHDNVESSLSAFRVDHTSAMGWTSGRVMDIRPTSMAERVSIGRTP
ncbi:hypothetical protein C8J56DRAFT_963819 [Mycena floridula]|nr:hypothetical protein C8J56DRAFT_963819 [Mycena floridula]